MVYENNPVTAHGIRGGIVKKGRISISQFYTEVLEIVRQFIVHGRPERFYLKGIGILIDNGEVCQQLVDFLAGHGFLAGSIQEQSDYNDDDDDDDNTKKKKKIRGFVAVDKLLQSSSYEWPVVIWARFHWQFPGKGNRFLRTVGSRAISKLYFYEISQDTSNP